MSYKMDVGQNTSRDPVAQMVNLQMEIHYHV